jgi:hypothetical protein
MKFKIKLHAIFVPRKKTFIQFKILFSRGQLGRSEREEKMVCWLRAVQRDDEDDSGTMSVCVLVVRVTIPKPDVPPPPANC